MQYVSNPTPTLAPTATLATYTVPATPGAQARDMRRNYEVKDKRQRARYHRDTAVELDRRGYPAMAAWHRESAEFLDPAPRPSRVRRAPEERVPENARFMREYQAFNGPTLGVNHRPVRRAA